MISLIGRKRKGNKTGFTLVELLIVTLIIGLLISVAMPSFRGMFEKLQTQQAVQKIASLIRYGQNRAVMERLKYRLNLDLQDGKYWLSVEKKPLKSPDWYSKIDGQMGKVYYLPQGVAINGCDYFVTFYPDGKTDKAEFVLSGKRNVSYTLRTGSRIGQIEITME